MKYVISTDPLRRRREIVVIGCGGTGGFVSEGLCRLFGKEPINLTLVDPDRVEDRNLIRQNFFPEDIDKFKSKVLAERLSRRYGRRIAYSVLPFAPDLLEHHIGDRLMSRDLEVLLIGCVDNSGARRMIAQALPDSFASWWLDAGNGYNSGQVLFGNTTNIELLAESFNEDSGHARIIPAPSLQQPSLLFEPAAAEKNPLDCAGAVQQEAQTPTINQAMATLVLEFVNRIYHLNLSYMAAYLDLEAGTLQTVPVMPKTIARMFSIRESGLMEITCHAGMMSGAHNEIEDEDDN